MQFPPLRLPLALARKLPRRKGGTAGSHREILVQTRPGCSMSLDGTAIAGAGLCGGEERRRGFAECGISAPLLLLPAPLSGQALPSSSPSLPFCSAHGQRFRSSPGGGGGVGRWLLGRRLPIEPPWVREGGYPRRAVRWPKLLLLLAAPPPGSHCRARNGNPMPTSRSPCRVPATSFLFLPGVALGRGSVVELGEARVGSAGNLERKRAVRPLVKSPRQSLWSAANQAAERDRCPEQSLFGRAPWRGGTYLVGK